jgi:hypothetical protein
MPLFESLQNLGFFSAIRESALAYPIILATHLSCIALFGGAILMTDLRLLNLAMTDQPVSDVVASLRIWKGIGFAVMVVTGALLAGAKAEMYYANPYFQSKLILLGLLGVHALVFRSRAYRTPKLAAYLSLVLWLGTVSAGRLIAYYEPKSRDAIGASRPGQTPKQEVGRIGQIRSHIAIY